MIPTSPQKDEKTTHTPGPWQLDKREVLGRAFDGSYRLICKVSGGSPAHADGNAHLIAAAPDLYEALKELVETLRQEAPGTALNNHRFDALGIKANNALAKAHGER